MRLLDAYVYGNFDVGETRTLSVKAGRHLVAGAKACSGSNIARPGPGGCHQVQRAGHRAKGLIPAGRLGVGVVVAGLKTWPWSVTTSTNGIKPS